jgi:chromosome segregation ATPase
MKGFLDKRDVVVPLTAAKDEMPANLPPLAVQIAQMEMQFEKLLYRIQNLERREKSQRNQIATLKRKVRKLEEASVQMAQSADETMNMPRPTADNASRPTASRSREKIEPLSMPDFEGAAEDLTQGRH